MDLKHELAPFSFCAANNLTNFKNKGEENNLYILFLIISTKIKSNTRTKALQKKLTYIKQVGLISLYYMSEHNFFFSIKDKIKTQWDES